MIFIKLTLQTNGKTVFVNAEKIIDLFIYEEGKGTAISLNLDSSYHVQETPEEIIKKIRAEEERQNALIELVSGEEISSNDVDLIDKLEGYIKDFRIEYTFDGYLKNSFRLYETTQGESFIRTCYPEINDCIKASFVYMDKYLKEGKY